MLEVRTVLKVAILAALGACDSGAQDSAGRPPAAAAAIPAPAPAVKPAVPPQAEAPAEATPPKAEIGTPPSETATTTDTAAPVSLEAWKNAAREALMAAASKARTQCQKEHGALGKVEPMAATVGADGRLLRARTNRPSTAAPPEPHPAATCVAEALSKQTPVLAKASAAVTGEVELEWTLVPQFLESGHNAALPPPKH